MQIFNFTKKFLIYIKYSLINIKILINFNIKIKFYILLFHILFCFIILVFNFESPWELISSFKWIQIINN